jgi:ligand-binding sensor domain-containing protein
LYVDQQQNLWMSTMNGILKASPNRSNKLFAEENGLPDKIAS